MGYILYTIVTYWYQLPHCWYQGEPIGGPFSEVGAALFDGPHFDGGRFLWPIKK